MVRLTLLCCLVAAFGAKRAHAEERPVEQIRVYALTSAWPRVERHFDDPHTLLFKGNRLITITGPDDPSSDDGLAVRDVDRVTPGPSGLQVAFDYQDTKLAEYRVAAGQLDGPFVVFAKDGSAAIEGAYRAGARDGTWREWHHDRQGEPFVQLEVRFVGGRLDGPAHYHDRTIDVTMTYRAGLLDGEVDFSDGASETHALFLHGVLDGEAHQKSPDGETVVTFRAGAATGPAHYAMSKDVVARGSLVDGHKVGTWEEVDASGTVRATRTYAPNEEPASYLVDGQMVQQRFVAGQAVALTPTPASYAWPAFSIQLASGPMFGADRSIVTRLDMGHAWGTAHSRDAEHATGEYLSIGAEVAVDTPIQRMTDAESIITLGPKIEVGTRFARYDTESRPRGTRLFVETTPYIAMPSASSSTRFGARLGLGVTSPAWPAWFVSGYSDEPTCNEKHTSCSTAGTHLLNAIMWLLTPVWSLDHVELVGELDADYRPRVGVMLGWGL